MVSLPTTPAFLSSLKAEQPRTRPAKKKLETASAEANIDNQKLQLRFHAEDRTFTLRTVRILCWILIALIPSSILLDYLAYPELVRPFAVLRFTCSLCLVPLLYLTYTRFGKRSYRALTVIVPMIPALFLSLMIAESGDPSSPYYAGLTLCLVALALMFHWTFTESLFAVALVITMYVGAVYGPVMHGLKPAQIGGFINNCVFLMLNSAVVISGSFYHRNIRIREFLTRMEVERQNKKLTQAMKQLRDTERQLVQSEKVASLGRMSAGIIHEINNPLSYTNQALFVLGKRVCRLPDENREPIERIIGDIKEGVSRVSTIISDLRSFSHPDSGQHNTVLVADTIQNAMRIMGKALQDSDVTVDLQADESLTVIGDRNHIIQILINLLSNAIAALKDRPSPLITIRAGQDSRNAWIRVRDNGSGIPKQDLEKIFEPFFTTKDVGEGMGMGLSICFRLMQQMGGSIAATSSAGQWTEFSLTFPVHQQAESVA